LCFSSAPIPPPHGNYGELYKLTKGLGKFWEASKLELLYTWLFDWMGNDKHVVVVGGDVHFGVHGYALRKDIKIPVIIASPITNQPYPDRSLAAKGMNGIHNIGTKITFTTLQSKARRCYGVLDLDNMDTKIVFSKDKHPDNISKYLDTMSQF
jgi:hypothetical protein